MIPEDRFPRRPEDEEVSAREKLNAPPNYPLVEWAMGWHAAIEHALEHLPLILEAAREAGIVEKVNYTTPSRYGREWVEAWRLIPSGTEPTPPPEKTERDK